MITRNGHNVKLIDFGLADTDSYSDFKQPSGTKGYVSPEQRVERTTDCRNDIYSLGCIITDLRLGRLYNTLAQRCKAPSSSACQALQHSSSCASASNAFAVP